MQYMANITVPKRHGGGYLLVGPFATGEAAMTWVGEHCDAEGWGEWSVTYDAVCPPDEAPEVIKTYKASKVKGK
jgi:hypothetical protein